MAKANYQSVDEYLAVQPIATQRILERVRSAIGKALPEASEAISYKIPCFKLNGKAVIYFAGWKEHYSLYPVSAELVADFKDELGECEFRKGTIRFPLSRPAPVKLIGRIAKLKAEGVVNKQRRA